MEALWLFCIMITLFLIGGVVEKYLSRLVIIQYVKLTDEQQAAARKALNKDRKETDEIKEFA